MATAVLERMTYEQKRDQRLGLIPCTPVTDYDLVMKDPVTGQHSYGRYIGTIMPSPPPGPHPPFQNGSYHPPQGRVTFLTEPSYASNDMMYPSKEIDGYDRAPPPHDYSINAPIGSALPLTASLMRPASAMGAADSSYHSQQEFRPISPSYRPMQRPKSAVAWLGGSRGPAAGRMTDAKPVHQSTAFTVEEIPIEQYYELTPLKKSHVRNDDQLVPRPEACEMSKHAINRPFPASHPLSSHTVEKAVFPKFAETPDDPRTGAEARRSLPKGANVPGNPVDVVVVKKTKGHGERHEIQHHPATNKPPLYWSGDNGFDQQVKMHGGRPQYYPAPTKTYAPNLEPRPSNMQISERTANALMNVERDQWTTTYNRDNTGYGSIHTMALDNFQDKVAKYRATGGEIDDTLTPRSVPMFDPARPVEGRIARHLTSRPAPQVSDDDWKARPFAEPRKMTDTEIEEQRLLAGREYLNLPEGKRLNPVYTSRNMQQELPKDNLFGKPSQKGEEEEEKEEQDAALDKQTDDSKLQQRYDFQQMEASNRWRELQSSKPNHDIEALRVKYTKLEDKEKPNVFYNHEGQYQEERAGMYQTDYIPEKMASTMRKPHEPAYSFQSNSYCLTDDNTDVLRAYSGIRHRDIPNISGRILPSQVLEPEILRKYQQKMQITPNGLTSRPEVQECGFIGRESEYQDHYNTEKILQERQMHPLARSEPSILMSHENQKLNNVRDFSLKRSKSVHFSNDVTVATGAGGEPIRLSSAPMNGHEDGEEYRRRIEETMRQKEQELRQQAYLDGVTLNDSQAASSQAMYQPNFTYPPVNQSYHTKLKRGNYGGTIDDMFVSKSTNFMPSGISQESKSSYESQFPRSYSLNFKDDPRFHWRPGMGRPRPRSDLMAIQDSFSKTNVINEFNNTFPEGHSDLRSHVRMGKKHVFDGIHAQTFRGN